MSTKTTMPPEAQVGIALFNLLCTLNAHEQHITKPSTRADLAEVLLEATYDLQRIAERLLLTPAQARVLRKLQTEIETATLN